MLIDNRTIVKRNNPIVYEKLKRVADQPLSVMIEPSKKGADTLTINTGEKTVYFHSKYNPEKEAATFLTQFGDLSDFEHILFIGTGLGYHIKKVLDDYPHLNFSICEPNLQVLNRFLETVNLTTFKERRLEQIYHEITDITDLDKFISRYTRKTLSITWTVTNQLYKAQIADMDTILVELLTNKKSTLGTNFVFQERWTINSLMNFSKVLSTPNILKDIKKDFFNGKPVLLVAAGPSLSLDIESIRQIKEEGRAYIFAVGSAIKALIANNILPDAFFSYDPGQLNSKVVEDIKENKLNIPIVFGSSIGFETIEDYPGSMMHFITSQDSIAQHILNTDEIIMDSPSIAVMTMQILLKLNASPIILAGQNLSYFNNTRYAEGIKYDHVTNELSEAEQEKQKFVESVDGLEIPTNETFLMMKNGLEIHIGNYSERTIINTTKHGAHIKGTSYKPIENVLSELLIQKNIVEDGWLLAENSVDRNLAIKRFTELTNEFAKLESYSKECSQCVQAIQKAGNNKVYTNIDTLLRGFDKSYKRITSNVFFKVVIMPMIANQYDLFSKRSMEVKLMSHPRKKIDLFNEIFASYINAILAALKIIEQVVEKALRSVNNEKIK